VKHWKETAEIFGRLARLAGSGRRAAVATVLRIDGSAYRRPGAKLLIEETGSTNGSISGGCLEADVREAALEILRVGGTRILHYETGDEDGKVWGLGLGCNGAVDIFVQEATSRPAMEIVERALPLFAGDRPFAISTVAKGLGRTGWAMLSGSDGSTVGSSGDAARDSEISRMAADGIARRESGMASAAQVEVFTEVLLPPPRLILFGATDDAIPLCAIASEAGLRVVVVDHREAFLEPGRFPAAEARHLRRPEAGLEGLPVGPRTFAVAKSHSFRLDREWTRLLLAAGVPYVGLLGPRARGQKILDEIGVEALDRVFTPVGLDLGADGPEQVAISIVSEILAVHAGRHPASLREKKSAIHAG
jgi:xanthine/CO dehydrogenase XdhC/CoxF family maturation factor